MSTTHTAGWQSYAKTVAIAVVTVALGVLAAVTGVLEGGIDGGEWIAVAVAGLTQVLVVLGVPNKGYVNVPPVPPEIKPIPLVTPDEHGVQPLDEPPHDDDHGGFPTQARP